MKRGVKKTDGDGLAGHETEDVDVVSALEDDELLEGSLALVLVAGENHLAHDVDTLGVEEHMLGTAETDTFGTVGVGNGNVLNGVSVGANLQVVRSAKNCEKSKGNNKDSKKKTRCKP